jgi:hypothetical protein
MTHVYAPGQKMSDEVPLAISVSSELTRLIAASRRRRKAEATGHMRERIAVALRGSRPSYFYWFPNEAYLLYLLETERKRELYEQWADRLLKHLDAHDLEIVDRRREAEA